MNINNNLGLCPHQCQKQTYAIDKYDITRINYILKYM